MRSFKKVSVSLIAVYCILIIGLGGLTVKSANAKNNLIIKTNIPLDWIDNLDCFKEDDGSQRLVIYREAKKRELRLKDYTKNQMKEFNAFGATLDPQIHIIPHGGNFRIEVLKKIPINKYRNDTL